MAETNQSNLNQQETKEEQNDSSTTGGETKSKTPMAESGDPGRTPGSAEGDEETIDADIREKEAEGKL